MSAGSNSIPKGDGQSAENSMGSENPTNARRGQFNAARGHGVTRNSPKFAFLGKFSEPDAPSAPSGSRSSSSERTSTKNQLKTEKSHKAPLDLQTESRGEPSKTESRSETQYLTGRALAFGPTKKSDEEIQQRVRESAQGIPRSQRQNRSRKTIGFLIKAGRGSEPASQVEAHSRVRLQVPGIQN
jgi:hypothetical protein